jgi:transcriptional regulator with XRE-family HTH domain
MGDLELDTVGQFAEFLGAERSQVSNWLQGYNLPPPRWMGILCRKRRGLTLDWIYRGVAANVPLALLIKLEAISQGLEVPLLEESDARQMAAQLLSRGGARRAGRKRTCRKQET